ncbi:hypothetical protein CSB07_00910 [Candidatus Gracilibacteria bacterium]|nr:MAG: hypothetical protein CSB07_00910 [Candidatus Gracilibacteria bacterium]PIE85779.1 MAG: hypothetical protein CSA08_00300 [Candidatus Gracilibacteria bacterium]
MSKDLNLKIYGLTTVGAKGQVIIPKELRNDLNVKVGVEFKVFLVEKVAFGILEKNKIKKPKSILELENYGDINIGTKFQFVIPSNIRKKLNINPGDSLIVIGKGGKGIGFIKNDKIEYLLDFIKKQTM